MRSQPIAMLLDRDGTPVDAWVGALEDDVLEEILQRAAELS